MFEVVIGWFLGLLAGPVSEAFRRWRRRRDLKNTVVAELRECRHFMATVSYGLRAYLGEIDAHFLEWILPIERENAEKSGNKDVVAMIEQLHEAASRGEQIYRDERFDRGITRVMRPYTLPLLESGMHELSLLPLSLRRELLAVRQQLSYYNQDVQRSAELDWRSFDSTLKHENYERVLTNLKACYGNMANCTKEIADRIGNLLQSDTF